MLVVLLVVVERLLLAKAVEVLEVVATEAGVSLPQQSDDEEVSSCDCDAVSVCSSENTPNRQQHCCETQEHAVSLQHFPFASYHVSQNSSLQSS